jgi:PAS domain S-box-containing protein
MMTGRWTSYLVAAVATVVAFAVRLALSPMLGEELPYITFFGAVMIAAWFGGLGPGLVATGLTVVLTGVTFVWPHLLEGRAPAGEFVGTLFFLATGVLISAMSERLHRARAEAHREAVRLRTTLQSIGDGVIVTDADGRVTSLNPVAEQLTGWTATEARGRALPEIFRIVNEATRHEVENPALRALRDGAIVGLANHTVLIARSGDEHPIDDSAAPIRYLPSTVDGSVLVFRDVTDRRRATEALRRNEEELSDFFENASVGLHWLDPKGIVLRANQAELDLLGYAADEFVGLPMHQFHCDPAVLDDMLARLARHEIVRNQPAELRCRDGSTRHVLISSSGRWDGDRLLHSRCFTLDVTERRRADEMRGLLAAVVESSEDAVITKSLEGTILSWNAGAEAMFGYTAAEMVGQPVERIVPESLWGVERDILAQVRRGERVRPFETLRVGRDGNVLDVSLSLSPIRDEHGHIVGASSIARDIRGRKALEASLRESDRRKDEFLAVLAHELRNPLAPIRNAVAALRLALPHDETLRHAGGIIERQVRQMTRLLDDLLDISRITHGKLELRRETVTLQSVIESALETSRPLLDAAAQPLSIQVPLTPVHLYADPVRMAQVFSNLLSNASKYSDPGSPIDLEAVREGDDVVVRLTDRGIGIAPDVQPALFTMFSQASDARSRAQGGVGIGLALVKGLVEMHGGRVAVHSAGVGRGSTFEVRLPVAVSAVTDGPTPGEDPARPADRRVLIADDNQDGADSLGMVIGSMGYDVRVVYSGSGAVETARQFEPHVVILDLGMPGMDGLEAARRIRALPSGKDAVLVALTGWGQDRDRQLTQEAGFDAHLVKPVDPLQMGTFLHEWAARV